MAVSQKAVVPPPVEKYHRDHDHLNRLLDMVS
ncbi:MAG: hypothetical protein ACI9P7_001028 [Candidatus Azotimanducaceae bacterium]|jgi:hypothetical protein